MHAFEHYGLAAELGKDNICPHIDKALARAAAIESAKPHES